MRGEAGAPEPLDKARVLARLQGFIHQLDAILPYLSLAVSAVGLLNAGRAGLRTWAPGVQGVPCPVVRA